MSLAELSLRIARRHDLPKEVARDLIVDLLGEIESVTTATGRCAIRGFGVFKLKTFAAKPGRNPKTGERVRVPPRRRVVFQYAVDRARLLDPVPKLAAPQLTP
jgi:integration host factor subunit beta